MAPSENINVKIFEILEDWTYRWSWIVVTVTVDAHETPFELVKKLNEYAVSSNIRVWVVVDEDGLKRKNG